MEVGQGTSSGVSVRIAHGSHWHSESELAEVGPYLFATFLATLVVSQALIWLWQRKHPQSFDRVALVALWLIPAVLVFRASLWLSLSVWIAYTAVSAFVMYRSQQRPIARTTPRLVYDFFSKCFQSCYLVATAGYVCILVDVLAVAPPSSLAPTGFSLLFYGLYFGVLTRDLCALCQSLVVSRLGLAGSLVAPPEQCALCGHALDRDREAAVVEGAEPPVTLSCKHQFHSACIRGWTMVGKRDTCPQCKEKVQLTEVLGKFVWEKQLIAWKGALDATRFLLVLIPILFTVTQIVLRIVW